jgi:hypothetical protein
MAYKDYGAIRAWLYPGRSIESCILTGFTSNFGYPDISWSENRPVRSIHALCQFDAGLHIRAEACICHGFLPAVDGCG